MNEITTAPVIVNSLATTAKDRKLDVARNAAPATMLALVHASGDLGKLARESGAKVGIVTITNAASNANYRPVAEYIYCLTGEPVVITNRGSFESLPDVFEAAILKIKASKSGGMRMDKFGQQVPNSKLALYMGLKAQIVDMIADIAAIHEQRKAQREQRAAEEALKLEQANSAVL